MKTILMTGAAGRIGTFLRAELAGKYKLRLSDIKLIRGLGKNETFVRADLTDFKSMLRLTKGVDAVLHLGGQTSGNGAEEGAWERMLPANIAGFRNTLEAARQNGVKRFLVATSNHAVGYYHRDETIDHTVYPKPDSIYGVSKVFNEALAKYYSVRYGMQMFCMRIGNVNAAPLDRRRLAIWISPRDMAQLVTIGIERRGIEFEIVYGISNNKRAWFDNRNAKRLGYRPQDRSEPYTKEILAREKPETGAANIFQGYAGGVTLAPARKKNKKL